MAAPVSNLRVPHSRAHRRDDLLKTRVYTVMVLLPLFVAALYFLPQRGWAMAIAPLGLAGAWEWAALAGWRVHWRAVYVVFTAAAGVGAWVFMPALSQGILLVAAAFWVIAAPLWLGRGWRVRHPLLMAVTGAILLVPLWLAMVMLHKTPTLLLVLMAVVWVSDCAAFFCGHQWGRRKLAPSISPGKTWEGVIGAAAAVALYYGLVMAAGMDRAPVLHGASGFALFMVLMALGVEGDLFESWIKRVAGVKDSGTLMPGHGGVLDRLDALTSSLPVAALVVNWA